MSPAIVLATVGLYTVVQVASEGPYPDQQRDLDEETEKRSAALTAESENEWTRNENA